MDKLDRFYAEHPDMKFYDQRPANRIRRYLRGAIVTREYAASINNAIRMYQTRLLAKEDPEVEETLMASSPLTAKACVGMQYLDNLSRAVLVSQNICAAARNGSVRRNA